MVIIDTNIWIEFFKGNEAYVEPVTTLLKNRLGATIEPIFAELLYGVRNSKDKKMILNYWNVIPKIELQPNYMIEAADYANNNKFYGNGIGLMDAIIIKAMNDSNCLLCTLDKKILRFIDEKKVFNL